MSSIYYRVVIVLAVAFLAGCESNESEKQIWEQVKFTDLTLWQEPEQADRKVLTTIDFKLYVFELPADDIAEVVEIWQRLHTSPLEFEDYQSFRENLFLAGFGQGQIWDQIRGILQDAGSRRVQTTSLMLADGLADDITIAAVDREQGFFYISKGSGETITLGPGWLNLRVRANKIPDSRGVCNVVVSPVFVPAFRGRDENSPGPTADKIYPFTSLGLRLKMSPGEFVLIGPERDISRKGTVASLFFRVSKPKPAARIYLFVCYRIED
ncbi:MAG: hypothetical protein JXB29_02750 [Sedimentisphaerales bacterium]|nr:hypothetical protein [Sedimentisphaerales bacterium]